MSLSLLGLWGYSTLSEGQYDMIAIVLSAKQIVCSYYHACLHTACTSTPPPTNTYKQPPSVPLCTHCMVGVPSVGSGASRDLLCHSQCRCLSECPALCEPGGDGCRVGGEGGRSPPHCSCELPQRTCVRMCIVL